MKTRKSMLLVLSSLLALIAGGLAGQGGGMQMPQGMQMPSPEEILKQLEANVKMMADQLIQQFDGDDDSALSLDEFTKMNDTMMSAGMVMEEEETDEEEKERLKKEFEDADTDDNDSLSKEEVIAYGLKQAKAQMSEQMGIEFPEETEEDTDDGDEAEDVEGEEGEEEEEE